MSVKQELVSGVFYTSVAKYAGILVTLAVAGVLSRMFTAPEFGIVSIATVIITFFSIFSDMGIGPAVIQHRELSERDLSGIFSLTVWAGAAVAVLFFLLSGPISLFYEDPDNFDPEVLRNVCRILSANLFFASINIVPNALILKEKRFRFAAVRSLAVQLVGGTAAIVAAHAGAGIYALTINPVFSAVLLFAINFREHPLALRIRPGRGPVRKVFAFSAYQFAFQFINYFSRNLDKLLMGRYMSPSSLGYYDKSYRLMMQPLLNISNVISPVLHPVLAPMQDAPGRLADSYLRVVRLMAFVGYPLAALFFFVSEELILIIFGGQWGPSVPALRILSLSVGIQMIGATSGPIFQAANAPRMLFLCGLYSAVVTVAATCAGIFAFGTIEAVAWCLCAAFSVNYLQTFYMLFCRTLRTGWRDFWRTHLSPLAATLLVAAALGAVQCLLPGTMPLPATFALKCVAAFAVWVAYIHLRGEYDLRDLLRRLRGRAPESSEA